MKAWRRRLTEAMPREEIPVFLTDLQALVAALREDRAWTLSPILRAHRQLVLDYLDDGEKKAAVARELRKV